MKINDLQQALLATYQGGRWAHIKRIDDYRDCDDLLFKAVFERLGDDCIIAARERGIDPGVMASMRLGEMIAAINAMIPTIYDGRVVISMEPPKAEPLIAVAPELAHA